MIAPSDYVVEMSMEAQYFNMNEEAPQGAGTQVFRTMIATAKEAGVSRIKVTAAGSGKRHWRTPIR